jgi:hypothetical protein
MVFQDIHVVVPVQKRHPKTNIHFANELEVSKARELISHACHTCYCNLENMYTQHKYQSNHIWNSYETNVQAWQ